VYTPDRRGKQCRAALARADTRRDWTLRLRIDIVWQSVRISAASSEGLQLSVNRGGEP
jgi:hypothetical protein